MGQYQLSFVNVTMFCLNRQSTFDPSIKVTLTPIARVTEKMTGINMAKLNSKVFAKGEWGLLNICQTYG